MRIQMRWLALGLCAIPLVALGNAAPQVVLATPGSAGANGGAIERFTMRFSEAMVPLGDPRATPPAKLSCPVAANGHRNAPVARERAENVLVRIDGADRAAARCVGSAGRGQGSGLRRFNRSSGLSADRTSRTFRTAANAAPDDRNRLHRPGRTMASGELLMTRTRFTSCCTQSFINRPAADRHDMAASHDVRPSKRQI